MTRERDKRDYGTVAQAAQVSGGAAAPDPPAGATAILDLSGEVAGAFGTVANGGSVGGNWTRNATAVAIAADGPNSMKYAYKAASTDYIKLGTLTLNDLVSQSVGMVGFIGKLTLAGGSTTANGINNAKLWNMQASDFHMLSSMENIETLRLINRGASLNQYVESSYTTDTWRAGVVRWDGVANKLYIKLNGDVSWAEAAMTQDIFSGAGQWALLSNTTQTNAIAKWMSYQTQSEETGDELLAHMVALAGL